MMDLDVLETEPSNFQTEGLVDAFVPWPVGTSTMADDYEPPLEAKAPWGRPSPDARRLLARLDAIADDEGSPLPDDVFPSPQAWRDARTFVLNLPKSLVHLPNIGLAADGEINFLWKQGGLHIDLGLYGSGTFSYYARDESGREYFENARSAVDGLPSEVASLVTA